MLPVFEGNGLAEMKSAAPRWIRFKVSPTLESKEEACQFLGGEFSGLPKPLGEELTLAAHELLGNAIEHGCRLNPSGVIDVSLVRSDRMILLHIRDEGEGFAAANTFHAAFNNPPDDPLRHAALRSELGMRPGGYGIMLVKQIADELIYNEAGNEVLLIKYLPAEKPRPCCCAPDNGHGC